MKGREGLVIERKSEVYGVVWERGVRKWRARVGTDPFVELGRFQHEADAIEAVRMANEFIAKGGNPEELRSLTATRNKQLKIWSTASARYRQKKREEKKAAQEVARLAEKEKRRQHLEEGRRSWWGQTKMHNPKTMEYAK